MSSLLRLGLFLFLAPTLGLGRMLLPGRYVDSLTDDHSDDSNIIVTHQSPDSGLASRPQIHNSHPDSQSDDPDSDSHHNPFLSQADFHILASASADSGSGFKSPNDATTPLLELVHARRALKKIKQLLGPFRLRRLMAADIALGNAQWHDILSSSSSTLGRHDPHPPTAPYTNLKLAQVHLLATQPCGSSVNFTGANFLGWFITSAFARNSPNLWAGHPEHYGVHLVPNPDGTLRGEILEPWGPLMTDSYVPRFTPLGGPGGDPDAKQPWMRELPDYPMQMVGEETLMDGSERVIANLHYAYRDVPADEGGCKAGKEEARGSGVEGIFAMWMPDATPDDVVEGLREHLEVEYYNWFKWAYEDIKSGAFKPQ